MFFAHIPGGYLLTRQHIKRFRHKLQTESKLKYYVMFGLLCSVLPDFDLLYFYTIDNRQHIHHSYWTHIPIFWLAVAAGIYLIGKWIFKKNTGVVSLILLGNTLLHLVLDSVAGGIFWLYPWSDVYVRLMDIPSRYSWWVFNYIFHWTFLLELCIISTATLVFLRDRGIALRFWTPRRQRAQPAPDSNT